MSAAARGAGAQVAGAQVAGAGVAGAPVAGGRAHAPMAMFRVAVAAVADLTPHLRRVVLTGPDVRSFVDDGPDQRVKLLLPRPGQRRPLALPADGWYARWQAMDPATRPVLRSFTVRAARPERAELDLDLVRHGDTGPASRWASRARPGDEVALFGPRAEYVPRTDTDLHLLVGDHTALPAVAAITERLPPDARGHVLVQVPDPDDELPLPAPPGMAVRWLHAAAGRDALTPAVRALGLTGARRPAAWVAGERATVAAVRRHLVDGARWPAERVTSCGYWRAGAPVDPS